MWSPIVLCLLVGFAIASKNPGWKDNTEYIYSIRGRTLASLHEVDNQYSGILLQGRLIVQPRPDGKLQAQISDAKYSQVHSLLSDGWNTHIEDSELSYKPLGMSDKPFQIDMKDGVVSDVIVSKEVTNWEANIIKSIVSQFQLNTNGARALRSKVNSLPDRQQNSAVFKTMEETVTGNTETLYDIHPIPEYVLQSEPWMGHNLELKGDGEVIEVVKHKNYSNNDELPLYHYGFAEIGDWEPGTNQMGKFFVRDSISRAILTGDLKRYTVHNTYTVNRIVMNPTLNNKEKGSVVSMVNVTLEGIQSQSKKIDEVSNPVKLGNLVYTYDNPFSGSNEVRTKKPHQGGSTFDFDSQEYNRQSRSAMIRRMRRSMGGYQEEGEEGDFDSSSSSSESNEFYKQDKPQLSEGLGAPLLPYTTGYEGMSIKYNKEINIMQSVRKMAQEIGNELQNPEMSLRKDSLDKFSTMSSLIRLMNSDELQQVARDLYSQSRQGPQYEAWSAFRDAVAESGTGPAFITIQDWIHSKKLDNEEGAQILSTMVDAVRQPTLEYMQSFFDFIRKPDIQAESPLNETALLSYTNLIRKVYVDKKKSGREYPVESFGSFRTDEGKKFVKESVIPHLTQKLHEAVSHADTYKIHAFIRALGNVGHPKILEAFEPYLEGKKQVSQFQRFMMIAAMDKLVETHPEVARSVLFKVYQNAGESQEVRVVAVHQMMRTSPPTDMLQRMASYTNIDTQEHVNAAVKSSIESAADLEGDEHKYLRSSAQAAKHLLTEKNYGVQHGSSYLRSYVLDELKLAYKVTAQSIGSEDRYYPKGVKYSVRADLGGLRQRLANLQAITSSIDELLHVGWRQTGSYQEELQKQKQNGEEQYRNQFSSQKIAQILNMKADEREQLEGSLWMDIGGFLQKFVSFDNHTIEQLPEVIRKFEEELKNGKKYQYTKLMNTKDMALSFPTEMGLPFLFTYDTPALFKVNGDVEGAASPQLWQEGKLHKPQTITFYTKMQVTVNSKIQGRLSFSTPFDHHQYISGFDKNFQMHIPLYGKFHMDIKKGQLEAEIEPKEIHQGARLFHYSTWPYTSVSDIKNFQPISSQRNTHHIEPKNLHSFDKIIGKKETGMAFRVQIKHERKSVDLTYLAQLLQKQGICGTLSSIWDDASMKHSEISVHYVADQSTTRKYILRLGFQHEYKPHSEGGSGADRGYWNEFSKVLDPLTRKENLVNKIGTGIKNAEIKVYDASIEFHGEKNIKYTVTGGFGKSNIDPVSRVMMYFKKSSDSQDVKPYEITLKAKSNIPNTNGLDLSFSFKHEPKADTLVEFTFGESPETSSEVKAQLAFRRSEERKQFLKEQSMYQKCQREMHEGNYQLPACANMTMNSNLLDRVNIKIQHKNIKPEVLDTMEAIYQGLEFNYYPTLDIDRNQGTGKENEIDLYARFDPDLRSVNVSIKHEDKESTIKNIHVGEWAKKIAVVHPVFHVRSRIESWIYGLETYRPICVVDYSQSSTFNNKTYPGSIGNHWTVMFQYVPKDARHQEQQLSVEEMLKSQTENCAVLVRQSPDSKKHKDVKITVSSPKTDYKVLDITMHPGQQGGSSGAKCMVKVNGQEVRVSDQQSHDLHDGYVQIYGLPNGEVKVEIRDEFYTIYDGQRVKLTITNGKFRDSVRGVCGAFSDSQAEDFLTAENCIARDPKKFVRSYEIEGGEGEQQRQQFSGRSNECIPVEGPLFANVISDQDAGRSGKSDSSGGSSGKCTHFQTRYVEENGAICFTIRPMPVCSSRCQQQGSIKKSVSVHCVQKSNVATMWKSQIDGGSSPNFSHKKESKTVKMELPKGCSE